MHGEGELPLPFLAPANTLQVLHQEMRGHHTWHIKRVHGQPDLVHKAPKVRVASKQREKQEKSVACEKQGAERLTEGERLHMMHVIAGTGTIIRSARHGQKMNNGRVTCLSHQPLHYQNALWP